MERDDFRALPGDVYSRGFLRNYGSYLGLNTAEVIAAYDGRNDTPRKRPRTGPIATQPARQAAAPPRRKPEQARIPAAQPHARRYARTLRAERLAHEPRRLRPADCRLPGL